MKITLATATAVITLALAGSAFADGRVTATLEAPVPAHTKFIAAHAVWICDGASCVADYATSDATGLSGCKSVAKTVGRISAFGQYKSLDEKALAQCNASAAPPANIGTASR